MCGVPWRHRPRVFVILGKSGDRRFVRPEMAGARQYKTYELFRWNFTALHTTIRVNSIYYFADANAKIERQTRWKGRRWPRLPRKLTDDGIRYSGYHLVRTRPNVDRDQQIFYGPPINIRVTLTAIFFIGRLERKTRWSWQSIGPASQTFLGRRRES